MSECVEAARGKAKIRESPDDGDPASMRRRPTKQLVTAAFDIVRTVGLALPDVEATTKYNGSPGAHLAARR